MRKLLLKLVVAAGCAMAWAPRASRAQSTLELGDPQWVENQPAAYAVRVGGSAAVTGLQFDLVYGAGSALPGVPALRTNAPKHLVAFRELSAGSLRVIVYSASNAVLPSEIFLDLVFSFGAGMPAGGADLRLANLVFVDVDGHHLLAVPAYGPLGRWRAANFSIEQWNDPLTGGDGGDLDGDGISNLVEYLASTDPRAAGAAKAPRGFRAIDAVSGKRSVLLRWWKAKNAPGVVAKVLGGTDLKNWSDAVVSTPTGAEDATGAEMEASAPLGARHRYFLKLQVQRSTP